MSEPNRLSAYPVQANRVRRAVASRIALLILATGPVVAQDDLPATPSATLHGSAGLSAGVRPEYDGATDSKTVIMPTINLF